MTQAYNLSQLANNLDSSGRLDATDGLVNAVPATNGGTGQAGYAVGDLLYASTTTALSKLADVAAGNALLSGGVAAAPIYGKIGLTTHVSGTLPVANGGTGAATLATNNVLLGNGTSPLQSVAPGASGNVLVSNGTTWTSGAGGSGGGINGYQAFVTNGTFTIPAGITKLKVTVVGGGGSGGNGNENEPYAGGGGGGGGTSIKFLTSMTPGSTLAVAIGSGGNSGPGGTSTVSSGTQTITTISAAGGSSGNGGGATDAGIGGTGGVGSSGTINMGGSDGQQGNGASGGVGGSSSMGGGGTGGYSSYLDGSPGRAYGGGGGGGGSFGGLNSSGTGAAGVVIFEY